jgi:hypothetical protein
MPYYLYLPLRFRSTSMIDSAPCLHLKAAPIVRAPGGIPFLLRPQLLTRA